MLKKISCFLVLIVIFLASSDKVFASRYYDVFDEHGMWISNEFVNKTKDGHTKYQQMTMIVRSSDKRPMYCLEPGLSLGDSIGMDGYDYNYTKFANLTESQWDRIKLLAYYGYGYKNHNDIKWYVITQYMIWQTNNLGYDIYFTDTLNGNRIDKYIDEMIELDNLVNQHYIIPNIKVPDLLMNEEIVLKDNNNVLEKYEIINNSNITTSKNGNELNIFANSVGNSSITFEKVSRRLSTVPVVYISNNKQNLLMPGNLDPISFAVNFNINYGTVYLEKVDSDTKNNAPNHKGILKNAKYGLYDENNILLEENNTNEDGIIKFLSKLKFGKYYVKEIQPSQGYQLDENKYYFDITKDNYNINLKVYEKVIRENFEIIKVLENDKTGILEFEKGIEFGIYDTNDNLLKTYITDDFGTIKFSLDYGKYIIKQHTSYEEYEKISDFKVEILENNKTNKLAFSDKKIIKTIEPEKPKIDESEYDESIVEEDNTEIEEDEMIVELPNTLSKINYNIIVILCFGFYIIKKITFKVINIK